MDVKPSEVPKEKDMAEDPVWEIVPRKETSADDSHEHNFVPLYFSVIVFALIVLSYIYCYATGIEVNIYREIGAIGISGLVTAACWYLYK